MHNVDVAVEDLPASSGSFFVTRSCCVSKRQNISSKLFHRFTESPFRLCQNETLLINSTRSSSVTVAGALHLDDV